MKFVALKEQVFKPYIETIKTKENKASYN